MAVRRSGSLPGISGIIGDVDYSRSSPSSSTNGSEVGVIYNPDPKKLPSGDPIEDASKYFFLKNGKGMETRQTMRLINIFESIYGESEISGEPELSVDELLKYDEKDNFVDDELDIINDYEGLYEEKKRIKSFWKEYNELLKKNSSGKRKTRRRDKRKSLRKRKTLRRRKTLCKKIK
jgi:hypothetical protein